MASESLARAWVRDEPRYIASGQEATLQATAHGALQVAATEPPYLPLARRGRIYVLSSGVVANAKAPVQDVPTTTAAWALYNGNATTGDPVPYQVVPLKIGVHLASGTSDIGATVWLGLSPTVQAAAVSNNTGIVGPKVLSNSASARTSLATLGGGVTLAAAAAWFPIGGFAAHAAAATPGSGAVFDVEGLVVVPPGYALGITVLSGAGTTAKYAVSVVYAEEQYARY